MRFQNLILRREVLVLQQQFLIDQTGRIGQQAYPLVMPGRNDARSGLRMMPPFPRSPLKSRTAGFPQYGFKAGISDGACPATTRPSRHAVCIRPSCTSLPAPNPRAESRNAVRRCTTVQAAMAALPQGPSLQSGLCCPGPSSLNWSHAPHSQAQRDFTALRLIPAAFAVRPLTAPRRPMSGSVLSLVCFLDMSSSETAGSSIGCIRPVPSPMTLAFDHERESRHFQHPHPPILVGNHISRLHYGSLSLRPVDLLALLSELTRSSPSQRGLLRSGFRRIDHSHRRRI